MAWQQPVNEYWTHGAVCSTALRDYRDEEMPWSNQVAVVTGGSRGIGRGAALLLARRGAAVCVNYAGRADAADAVTQKIKAGGGRAIAIGADVADEAAVKA